MSYFITFICGLAVGLGCALFLWLKNKWARDELGVLKQQAAERQMEVNREIKSSANKKLTGSESDAMDKRMGGREIKRTKSR